jgi:hypothetical protein
MDKDKLAYSWGYDSFESFLHDCDLDVDKVKGRVAQGVEHVIFAYGKNQVLKIPLNKFYFYLTHVHGLHDDLEVMEEYFGKYLLPSKVFPSRKDERIQLIVQKRVEDFSHFDKNYMKFPKTREQFEDIYQKLLLLRKKRGLSLDLVGGDGVYPYYLKRIFKREKTIPFMSNILVSEDLELSICDFRLTPTRFSLRKGFWGNVYTLYGRVESGFVDWYLRQF